MKRICTYNCQGLLDKTKQRLIADDFKAYQLKAMLIQETHMKNEGMLNLLSTDGDKYHLYYSGHKSKSIHGVGIIVCNKTKVRFTPISDRICMITTKFDNNIQINLISAYAPTLDTTLKTPDETENFYNDLDSVIKLTSSRDTLIIGGDFNAKVKPNNNIASDTYTKNIGKFSKGYINHNGQYLLEFAKRHNLKLTNTFFKHKPCHITTWECPKRINAHMDSRSSTTRRNPYRNQIDYLIVRNCKNLKINDSRSYGGMRTKSDHKPVIADINIKWKYMKHQKPLRKINFELFHEQNNINNYNATVSRYLENQPEIKSNQDRWTNVINITKQAAIETLGYTCKKEKYKNPEIKELSEQQKKLNLDQNSITDPIKQKELKIERNKILTKIHNLINSEETNKIEHQIAYIAEAPDDSRRMFEAVKNIKKITPKPNLLIQTKTGLTANDEEQTKIIANYFKTQFHKNAEPLPQITPRAMRIPFTQTEIEKAVRSLKNNKSPGNDEIVIELIKYAPTEICNIIASIYNDIAYNGSYPKEITQGLLCALQKPGKPKGPPQNLRPIILLSVLRKILAVCMMKRIGERIDKEIPQSQAAYRKGRSTTEHVFSTKLIIERTLTSKNETVYLIMHDMSKAFDSINRKTLLNDLQQILQNDELHLIKVMLNVELSVKCGNFKSDYFQTDTGAPQGDCASANEFTFYLAKTLEQEHNHSETDSSSILKEHSYFTPQQTKHITINQEYADDISEITSNPERIKHQNNCTIKTSCTKSHNKSFQN